MLTGHATVDTAVEAIQLGAFNYLMKPCEIDDLVFHIQEALKRKRGREARILEVRMTPYLSRERRDRDDSRHSRKLKPAAGTPAFFSGAFAGGIRYKKSTGGFSPSFHRSRRYAAKTSTPETLYLLAADMPGHSPAHHRQHSLLPSRSTTLPYPRNSPPAALPAWP